MDKDGAVRSIQAANVDRARPRTLERLWTPENLERLARTYWKYLSRVTLGLIRVTYTEDERAVVLLVPPARAAALPRARVRVRARRPRDRALADRGRPARLPRGRDGRGYLEIDVRRRRPRTPGWSRVHVEVEVASFYPAIATWLSALRLLAHAVAHPRDRHPRLPALARAARARGVARSGASRRGPARRAPREGRRHHRRRDAVGLDRRRSPPAVAGVVAAVRALTLRVRPALTRRRSRSAPAASRGRGRDVIRRTVPERVRMTSDSVEAPRGPGSARPAARRRR